MKIAAAIALLAGALFLASADAAAAARPAPFSFGVIAKPVDSASEDADLREALAQSDADDLAFVVASGVKAANAPCTDTVFRQRYDLLRHAKNGLVVSLAASDWALCTQDQHSIAFDRINRLRDLFFNGDFSLGDSKIIVDRQSVIPEFHSYAENMRWRIHDVAFATLDLPSNDNNYIDAAGRNSEYEDRHIANADWLKRVFITARLGRLDGIVLFCDGDPMIRGSRSLFSSSGARRGFVLIRRQILAEAARFHGRILIVHNDDAAGHASEGKGIIWHGNIGTLHVDAPWQKITVDAAQPKLFSIASRPMPAEPPAP